VAIEASGFAVFREQVDRRVYEPGFGLWLRLGKPVRRLWRRMVDLPDRGAAAADCMPSEFYRFPPF